MNRLLFSLLALALPATAATVEYTDGTTVKFNPSGNVSGLNVGAHPSDPATLINGDLWYNSTSNALKARINGATVSLGEGGGGGAWGTITGTLGDQTDLQSALDARQSLDSDLTAIAALTTSVFGRGLLDDANASDARSSLQLGTMATAAASDYLPLAAGVAMSGAITFTGTDHPGIRLNNLTTTQRNAMTPLTGYLILNTTTGNVEYYTGSTWATVGSGAASSITGTPIFPGDDVDALIAGLTASNTTKNIYSTQNHAGPTYVRNTSAWAYSLDLTCASPWNSGNAELWAGTAITPRHIVMAQHAYVANGSTIRFITSDNTIVTRTVTTGMQVGSTDIRIGILDSDLPATIKPAKLLPDDYAHWLTTTGVAVGILDQEEKILVADIASLTSDTLTIEAPSDAQRLTFNETLISGDSGNPLFIFPNGQTVLLGCGYTASTAPSLINDNRAGVLAAIATLGAYGHAPVDANLDLGVLDGSDLSEGGNGATDSGKVATYDAAGSLTVSTELIVQSASTAAHAHLADDGTLGVHGVGETNPRELTFPDDILENEAKFAATRDWTTAGFQALDADLTDLADGSLTGSKVGTGIPAGNITTGTIAAGVLGTGTADSGTVLHGDNTWSAVGDVLLGTANAFTALNTSTRIMQEAWIDQGTNLAAGLTLTVSNKYRGTLSSSQTLATFSGTVVMGAKIVLALTVTNAPRLTFPPSLRAGGTASTITYLDLWAGYHTFTWEYNGANWVLWDTQSPLHNISASAPTVDDDITGGYSEGSEWRETTSSPDALYRCFDNTDGAAVWVLLSNGTGGGDASTNTATSVDSEIAIFSGTGGKTIKRATTTGLLKGTSGVISAATAGTDYSTPSSTDTLTNKTLGAGALTLAENASIALDPAGSADGKYTGITIAGTAGATLAFGDIVYLAAADSRWELADCDSATTSGNVLIGMVVLAAAADGSATTILLNGTIRADTAFPALTISAPAYISGTAGDIQVAAPSTTGQIVRRVGFALTADELIFNPSADSGTAP